MKRRSNYQVCESNPISVWNNQKKAIEQYFHVYYVVQGGSEF